MNQGQQLQQKSLPHLYICAFSTPDYEPFNTIFDTTLAASLKQYRGTFTVRHEIYSIPDTITGEHTEYLSKSYKRAIIEKVDFIMKSLVNFKNCSNTSIFIFSDCDIQFFEKNSKQWNNMIEWYLDQPNMIAFIREEKLNKLNSGFFMIKHSYIDDFINIMNYVKDILIKDIDNKIPGDQEVLQLLQKEMNIAFIPDEYIIFGHYTNYTALLHHACGFPTRKDKIDLLELVRKVVESDGTLALIKLIE